MSTLKRRIPPSGINLFQLIYVLIREYESATGKKAINLSLGNPDLIPPAPLREMKARLQLLTDYDLHTYAEDNNVRGLSEAMVEVFTGVDYRAYSHLKAVPIPGIKTATALLPLACGLHLQNRSEFAVVSQLPAYDVVGTWATSYLATQRIVWPLAAQTGMGLDVDRLALALKEAKIERPNLLFVIRPGNPASRGASLKEWKALIEFCIPRGIRLVNDGAYTTLCAKGGHVPLIEVAKDYPELEWAEMLSVSKAFSDPGARLGVLVGSAAFVEDFILIKGNTESGPVPSIMAAYAELFKDRGLTRRLMDELYQIYQARLDYLVPKLKSLGLEPACETTAGFFTLWKTPDRAYGFDLHEESKKRGMTRSELFNRLVIERAGVVGVHFQGAPGTEESFIRYAVCTDVLSSEFQTRFEQATQGMGLAYK